MVIECEKLKSIVHCRDSLNLKPATTRRYLQEHLNKLTEYFAEFHSYSRYCNRDNVAYVIGIVVKPQGSIQ